MTALFTDTETVMLLSRSERRDPKVLPRERREPAKVEQAVVRMRLEKAAKPRRVAGVDKRWAAPQLSAQPPIFWGAFLRTRASR